MVARRRDETQTAAEEDSWDYHSKDEQERCRNFDGRVSRRGSWVVVSTRSHEGPCRDRMRLQLHRSTKLRRQSAEASSY